MTREEAIDWLARMKSNTVNHTLDMPLWWNEPLAEALEMAIKALETVEEFEKAQIITGGRLNGKTYAYKCGLEDGRRKALEQEPVLDKIEEEIKDTLYIDSLIFTELIDFKNGKIDADDVIEEFNRVTRMEVLRIIDKYRAESEE